MPVVQRYRKLPIEISAIELRAYGDFTRAVNWISDNGGSASFCEAGESRNMQDEVECSWEDHLLISALEGTMEAGVGWFVIQGVKGEFYACEGEIFRLTYEAVAPEPVEELTGTGTYVVGKPDGSLSLVGGAALQEPA